MSDTELEFLREIDARFPFNDEARWKNLIDRGVAISASAAFMLLFQICVLGAPSRASPSPALQLAILEYWKSHFDHPAIDIVMPAAVALINRTEQTAENTIAEMQRLMDFPGLYDALNILSYACDDADGRVEVKFNAIISHWSASA